jgi:hypothetical protein
MELLVAQLALKAGQSVMTTAASQAASLLYRRFVQPRVLGALGEPAAGEAGPASPAGRLQRRLGRMR